MDKKDLQISELQEQVNYLKSEIEYAKNLLKEHGIEYQLNTAKEIFFSI